MGGMSKGWSSLVVRWFIRYYVEISAQSHRSLTCDASTSFSTYAEIPLMKLSSNLTGELITLFLMPDWLSGAFHSFAAVPWSLFDWIISAYLHAHRWWDSPQIWWEQSSWDTNSYFRSYSIESRPFPGLWYVQQFSYTCRQTADSSQMKPKARFTHTYVPLIGNVDLLLPCLTLLAHLLVHRCALVDI